MRSNGHLRSFLPMLAIFIMAACGGAGSATIPITDPEAPTTMTSLFGGTLEADGQRVIRDAKPEDLEKLSAQAGARLETVHFKTLTIEGGPTLVFHATYAYVNGVRSDCRACDMTLSATAYTKKEDGTWEQQAFEPYFAVVSAANEVLPVEALSIGSGRWLLQHESCWCGAGGDCMCLTRWCALEKDPAWFKPLLSQEFHYSHEDEKSSYAEGLTASVVSSSKSYPDLEIMHTYSETPMRRNAKTKTREEKSRFSFDADQRAYVAATP